MDWFLAVDAHIFLGHPHQGIIFHLKWRADILAAELLRLYEHQGFPTGEGLKCPIFLQNKFQYLSFIDLYVNSTYLIPLDREFIESEEFREKVFR